jgi:signal transduction histidine kinase
MDISSHRIDFDNRTAILSLAKDITEQVNAENQLEETTDDVRRLNVHLQSVREEERISIAREIHDELGQQLTGLKMDAAWLTKKINANETEQRERLTSMIALIDDTVKTVRRISSDLRPGILDDLGLIAALEWQCSEFERRTDIRCTFSSDRTEVFLEKNCTIGIFRIYQESLTNVLRHSQATTLTTEISLSDEYFNISIKDNGVGFDLTEAKNKKTFGLTGMKERARMSNCILIIDSKKGVGTSVILNIPKSQLKLKPEYEYIDS